MPVQTKKMIAENFLTMIKHKSIDKITVTDLVDSCGISRQTFYYYFQDVLGVVEWSMEQSFQETLQKSLAAETTEEAMKVFINMAIENHDLMKTLVSSPRGTQIQQIVIQGVRTSLRDAFSRERNEMWKKIHDPEAVLDFYAYGITGLLMNYTEKKQLDVDLLAKQICQLFSGPE